MFVDMGREDEIVLTYIPLQEGRKTTGNMIVGDFTERNVGAETRTIVTQREGKGGRCASRMVKERSTVEAGVGGGKKERPHFSSW